MKNAVHSCNVNDVVIGIPCGTSKLISLLGSGCCFEALITGKGVFFHQTKNKNKDGKCLQPVYHKLHFVSWFVVSLIDFINSLSGNKFTSQFIDIKNQWKFFLTNPDT